MTYIEIKNKNKDNCKFIQNKCRIRGLCNFKMTCLLDYEDGDDGAIDIIHVIRMIKDGKIAVTNLSVIRRQIEKICNVTNRVHKELGR